MNTDNNSRPLSSFHRRFFETHLLMNYLHKLLISIPVQNPLHYHTKHLQSPKPVTVNYKFLSSSS